MAFLRYFPRFDAALFLRMEDDKGCYLTAEASALGIPPGRKPHGIADGINLSGQPEGGGPKLDRAAFYFVESGDFGWLYRNPMTGQEVRIWND
jgi:hypothetical protein